MTFYGFIVFGRQKRGETLFISCRCKEWPRLTVLGSFSKCPTGFRAALFAGRSSNRNGWDGGDSPVLPDWDAVDSSASPGVPPECAALPAAPGPLLSGFEVGEKPGASPSFPGFPSLPSSPGSPGSPAGPDQASGELGREQRATRSHEVETHVFTAMNGGRQPYQLFRNDGDGKFTKYASEPNSVITSGRSQSA